MVHVKIILDKRREKTDGTYSINYRITDVKKVYTIYSGISVEEKFWDDAEKVIIKKHPNNQILNATINKKFYELQKAILQFDDKEFAFEVLKQMIDGKAKDSPKITFLQFSDKIIKEMMEVKRTGNAIVISNRCK